MDMDTAGKSGRHKMKNKKPPTKTKTPKKKKSDGPTCSMFLAELTKKWVLKKKREQEEQPVFNIVHTIIETISNALPITVSKKTMERDSPMQMVDLQKIAPELMSKDTVEFTSTLQQEDVVMVEDRDSINATLKNPRMPIMFSDVLKPIPRKVPVVMADCAVYTGGDYDVASEITKHVNTLRKISLIAEEFNQKTAKNLIEIVDSVQEDLIKKLVEIKAEKKAKDAAELQQEHMMAVEEEPLRSHNISKENCS